jgi:hypothetical protein
MHINKSSLQLHADVKAVITQFLYLPGSNRISNVVKRVAQLEDEGVGFCCKKVIKDFAERHRNIEKTLMDHFSRVEHQYESSLQHF